MKRPYPFALCVAAALCGALRGAETVVTKVAETFDAAAWPAGGWSSAKVSTSLAPGAPSVGKGKSMVVEAAFSGRGFQHFSVSPAEPLTVPGRLRSVTLRCRKSDRRYALVLRFRDGWGCTQVNKTKLEWPIAVDADSRWQTVRFDVPGDWVQPITIAGLAGHNWFAKTERKTVRFELDELTVRTDVGEVDLSTGALKTWKPEPGATKASERQPPATPLREVRFSTGEVCNVFSRAEPSALARIRNWRAGKLTGRLTCRVLDEAGKTVDTAQRAVAVESVAAVRVPLNIRRFGRYTLKASFASAGGGTHEARIVFARIPPWRRLDKAGKLASPYGVNVHGGRENMVIEPFRKAGAVWFRDYAFGYEWLLRAKGADGRYAGWPGFTNLVGRYERAGVRLLPCLSKAIRPLAVKEGKVVGRVGPDRAWVREIAAVVNAFPRITHWELGNEYDLKDANRRAEELIDWRNYRAYHRTFGEVLRVLGMGELTAVEQGRAGIWPRRVERCVRSGDFDRIGVINSHHYCGTNPPETDIGKVEALAGFDADERVGLFFDRLRAVQRAAVADGRNRQSWLTEFGWDTLAGKVVSPRRQAAYLARGWMVAMAAGTDKCFWFYDYDSAEPKQFFDGCGLLAANGEPKLSLCALAGLTHALSSPHYVGSIEAGANTAGYVFENDGKLVAALWAIEGNADEVTLPAEKLLDFLGNEIGAKTVRLDETPTYAIGLSRDSRWYRQTAYDLASPYLVAATAGDSVPTVLRIRNNRRAAMVCTAGLTLPEGWRGTKPQARAAVAPGERTELAMPFVVPPAEPLGRKTVRVRIAEGWPIKEIRLQVLVRPPLAMHVGALRGRPGKATVKVDVVNRSAKAVGGVLRLHLPASWQTARPEIRIEAIKPNETRQVECPLTWSAYWKAGETACVEFDAGAGRRISRPVIPPQLPIHRAGKLKMDGRLDDWPDRCRLGDWMLGCTLGRAKARVHLAWSAAGLFAGVEVHDSRLQVSDPRSFWAGDCLELFVDTRDDKRHRLFEPGDHQFWFVPLVDKGRVYAGQWKRKDETPATRYDLAAVRGAARREGDGYVMELFLPAGELKGFRPKVGARIGLNCNLTVKGARLDREVYWPTAKGWGVLNLPKTWGTMVLAE